MTSRGGAGALHGVIRKAIGAETQMDEKKPAMHKTAMAILGRRNGWCKGFAVGWSRVC